MRENIPEMFNLGVDGVAIDKYKQAETYLKDYLTGKLQRQVEKRKLELKYPPKKRSEKDLRNEEPDPRADTMRKSDQLEREVISYVDDGTYVFLKNKENTVNKFLEFLKKTDRTTHRILLLFYYHNLPWMNVADAVGYSESGCRKRRRKAIKDLQEWL